MTKRTDKLLTKKEKLWDRNMGIFSKQTIKTLFLGSVFVKKYGRFSPSYLKYKKYNPQQLPQNFNR